MWELIKIDNEQGWEWAASPNDLKSAFLPPINTYLICPHLYIVFSFLLEKIK